VRLRFPLPKAQTRAPQRDREPYSSSSNVPLREFYCSLAVPTFVAALHDVRAGATCQKMYDNVDKLFLDQYSAISIFDEKYAQ
jgi:hypothetical protein